MPQAAYNSRPNFITLPRASGTGNGSVAPVCPTSGSQRPPGMPGVMLPSIPRATDLPSAILVINQISQLLQFVFNPPVPSTPHPPSPTPTTVGPTPGSGSVSANWSESGRNVDTIAVHNPADDSGGDTAAGSSSNYVMVDRITALYFTSTIGEQWVWTLAT